MAAPPFSLAGFFPRYPNSGRPVPPGTRNGTLTFKAFREDYDGRRGYSVTVCIRDRTPSEDGPKRCGVSFAERTPTEAFAAALEHLADETRRANRKAASPKAPPKARLRLVRDGE